MRTCIRCGSEMKEGCAVRQQDSAAGVTVMESERFFAGGIGKIRAAVCMECGEVSLYINREEIEKYRSRQK